MDARTLAARVALPCLCVVLAAVPAVAQQLPDTVPVPQVHAPPAGNVAPQRLGDAPVPEPRPDRPSDTAAKEPPAPAAPGPRDKDAQQDAVDTPAVAPIPPSEPPRPDAAGNVPTPEPVTPPDPRSAERPASTMPAEETACRQRLRARGVDFADRPAEHDGSGCSLPYPMAVSGLGGGVALEPEALMNCAMAEAAARFAADVIAPTAKREFGAPLTSIAQASGYVCRPRNGSTKLSEHAFGNALDIASFTLTGSRRIDVILRPQETEARFLGTLRKAACGPFKTVLGPGSDADHATHLHLDLAPRRNGGTVCD
jgi:hypothetical protein